MNCPFCQQGIRDAAIKCRFCGEILDAKAFAAERARTAQTPAVPPLLPVPAEPKLQPPLVGPRSPRGISPKKTLGIAIGVVLLVFLGALFAPEDGALETRSGLERHETASRPRQQTARQIITEHAQLLHGRNARIEVIGGFYGGSYQVNVWKLITGGIYEGGYDRFSYTATVDENRQRITSWELYDHN